MNNSIPDNKCPICSSSNSCRYIKQGNSEHESCWCEITEYAFSVYLLACIPAKFKDKACVCENCAHKYQKAD